VSQLRNPVQSGSPADVTPATAPLIRSGPPESPCQVSCSRDRLLRQSALVRSPGESSRGDKRFKGRITLRPYQPLCPALPARRPSETGAPGTAIRRRVTHASPLLRHCSQATSDEATERTGNNTRQWENLCGAPAQLSGRSLSFSARAADDVGGSHPTRGRRRRHSAVQARSAPSPVRSLPGIAAEPSEEGIKEPVRLLQPLQPSLPENGRSDALSALPGCSAGWSKDATTAWPRVWWRLRAKPTSPLVPRARDVVIGVYRCDATARRGPGSCDTGIEGIVSCRCSCLVAWCS